MRRESPATGDRHHRQRGQDDNERNDRGVARGSLSGHQEQGQPEQPPGLAVVTPRTASWRRRRGDGARDEPRRRDPAARRELPSPRCACGSTSAMPILDISTRRTALLTRRPRSSRARRQPTCSSCNADDPRVMERSRVVRRAHSDLWCRRRAPTFARTAIEDRGIDGTRLRVSRTASADQHRHPALRARQRRECPGGHGRGPRARRSTA